MAIDRFGRVIEDEKKLSQARSALQTATAGRNAVQAQRAALIRPPEDNRLGQGWGARDSSAFARDGAGDAMPILERRLDAANASVDRASAAVAPLQRSVNIQRALASVGAAPVVAPPRPQVKFAGTDAMPDSMFRRPKPAAASPPTPTNQQPPQAGASNPGAPAPTTPGAQIVRTVDRNGNSVYSNAGDPNAPAYNAQTAALGGTVNQQSFGTAPAINRNIGGRQVASTFGMSALDPRLNEANAQPRGPNVGFRNVDAMIDFNANQDAVAAQRKLLSDLDSDRFRLNMIAGNPGRRGRAALAALDQNASTRAAIANGMATNSAGAVQGREERDNRFGIAGMEQQGQNYRTLLDADSRSQIAGMQDATTREGLRLGHEAAMAQVNRPQYITDAQNHYRMLANGTASTVMGEDGKPITAARTTNDAGYNTGLAKNLLEQMETLRDVNGKITDPQRYALLQAQLDAVNRTGPQQSSQVPPGMSLVGTDPRTGKNVYRDANGNLHTDE